MEQRDFESSLHRHLMKAELEYRAKMLPHGSEVGWLVPYCTDVESISELLRSLGFRIRIVVDKETFPGEWHRWVITTSGIVVYANTEYSKGLVAQTGK